MTHSQAQALANQTFPNDGKKREEMMVKLLDRMTEEVNREYAQHFQQKINDNYNLNKEIEK